ncbi:MAG: hypothetical protein Q8K32_26805 [Archangium sp.]|nr:hypothetical protein [Archangium sp.]
MAIFRVEEPTMNALTRTQPLQLEVGDVPVAIDLSLSGVIVAVVLWLLLHAAIIVSWLSAGTV